MIGVRFTRLCLLVTVILFASFLSLFDVLSLYILRQVVSSFTETWPTVNASFDFLIAITLLLSSFFIHRLNKARTLSVSFLAISIMIVPLLFVSSIVFRLTIIFVAGIFFGIAQLTGLTYLWDLTVPEERGRMAGLGGFLTLPIYFVITFVAGTFDFSGLVILALIISLGTSLTFLLITRTKAMFRAKKDGKEWNPEKRVILLYAVPWALFSLVNATFAINMSLYVFQSIPFSYYIFFVVLQLVAAIFGALGGGIIADFFGRKLPLIFGLTSYGLASALIGLVENYDMFCFAYVANGLTWGIFLTLYLVVVWGDLADKESCARRYSIGLTIAYLSKGIGFLFTNQISQTPLVISSLVSCLLIFLSNIPLILAPELLSSDFREKIRLKLYEGALKKTARKLSQNQG